MSFSTIKHLSHPEHPLVLKEDDVIGVDATCSVCDKPVAGSPTYTCSSSDDIACREFYLHKSCAELPKQIIRDKLDDLHPLALLPRNHNNACDFCSSVVKFAYACDDCDFDLCVVCAELPKEIIRDKLDLHPLALLPRPPNYTCDFCSSVVNFAYACDDCLFDLCVVCAFITSSVFDQRVIRHQGHKEHTLTLQRRAFFHCDACWKKTNDYSYVCFTCDFWIHKKCALSPLIIPAPTYHHHPLNLIFSIPVMHRYFNRYCLICKKLVRVFCWSYYCQKCTIFVHLECSTSTVSLVNEIEENGVVDDEPDLLQFPLPAEESLLDLIITRCSEFQVKFQADGENSTTMLNDPHIIKEHWSHRDHPLEMQQFTFSENELHDDDNDNYDDGRVLICDGCIQPITFSHVSYYACIQCHFFLHTFCATKLPAQLPVGACSFHPQHSFNLGRYNRFYDFFRCEICLYSSNGFYYKCEICDIRIEIRCAFLPTRIRHKSHKKHSLVQRPFSPFSRSKHSLVRRPFSRSKCSASNFAISEGVEYACETCSTFQIHILNAFYPSRLKHRYDDHTISLKHPPFFYEGVIYCEICEDQVDNQLWLYHCDKCDHSFHFDCIRWYENVKLGGTIKHSIGNKHHTLTFVLKMTTRKNSSPYFCVICGQGYKSQYFFECEGCGYLACIYCIRRKYGE